MVSELAGEGAMSLPAPASHAELRRFGLQRQIRRGSEDRSAVLLFQSSISRSVKNLSKVLINFFLFADFKQSRVLISSWSRVLITQFFTAFNRNRSVNVVFAVFDRDSWSRSGENLSAELVVAVSSPQRRTRKKKQSITPIPDFASQKSQRRVSDLKNRVGELQSEVKAATANEAKQIKESMKRKRFGETVIEIDPPPPNFAVKKYLRSKLSCRIRTHFSLILCLVFIERSALVTSEASSAHVKSKESVTEKKDVQMELSECSCLELSSGVFEEGSELRLMFKLKKSGNWNVIEDPDAVVQSEISSVERFSLSGKAGKPNRLEDALNATVDALKESPENDEKKIRLLFVQLMLLFFGYAYPAYGQTRFFDIFQFIDEKKMMILLHVSFGSSNGIFGYNSNITKENGVPQIDVNHVIGSKFDEHDIPYDEHVNHIEFVGVSYCGTSMCVDGEASDIESISSGSASSGQECGSVFAGVVDGMNIWANDLAGSLSLLESLEGIVGKDKLVVSTSCSLLHTAVDLVNETKLDDEIKSWLAFAAQKVVEVNALAKALAGQKDEAFFSANAKA
nr:5-methyltetrahydropteroyltriglutamate--homocysteine methyltransferase [Ipomoea batatas]